MLLAATTALAADRFTSVLGVPRLPDAELLLLRGGTRQTGHLGQATIRLHTAHGDLAFPTTALAGLDLTDDRAGLCAAITEAGDRFSGFLQETTLALRTVDGRQTNDVPPNRALKLLFRLHPPGPQPRPADCLVLLRNGDFFTAHVLNGRWTSTNREANLDWNSTPIQFASFPEPGTGISRLVQPDGEVISARAATEEFRFALAAGFELAVPATRLDRMERLVSGELPPDLQARLGVPTARTAPGLASAAPPDARVVPFPGMVWIPPGEFTMGSPPEEQDRDLDEGPLTRMILPAGYWIGRSEVTQTEFQRLMGRNPSQYQYEGETLNPVERVSWLDAVDYCRRLTERERDAGNLPDDYAYRLPTEAEWEYACRAGTTTRFSFGDDDNYALAREFVWFSRNSDSTTHPVGTRKPNPWGLHDMHGNVLEWCLDAWRGSLPGGTATNIAVPPAGTLRAVRGGSWLYDARYARSANRDSYGSLVQCSDLGFRIVLARSGESVRGQ